MKREGRNLLKVQKTCNLKDWREPRFRKRHRGVIYLFIDLSNLYSHSSHWKQLFKASFFKAFLKGTTSSLYSSLKRHQPNLSTPPSRPQTMQEILNSPFLVHRYAFKRKETKYERAREKCQGLRADDSFELKTFS